MPEPKPKSRQCAMCGDPLKAEEVERCASCKGMPKPKSRQLAWQEKMRAEGRCQTCGIPLDGRSTQYCERHRAANAELCRKRYYKNKNTLDKPKPAV